MENDFRHNLRSELDFQDLTVKELSLKTGIPKSTLDCYLGIRATMPPADIAVKIAKALDTTVEFLITGDSSEFEKSELENQSAGLRECIKNLLKLDETSLQYTQAIIRAVLEAQGRMQSHSTK